VSGRHLDLARAEFATIRLRLLKSAVRVQEIASRIRLAYAARCPEAALVRGLAGALAIQSMGFRICTGGLLL
jgi:hypothetical protein